MLPLSFSLGPVRGHAHSDGARNRQMAARMDSGNVHSLEATTAKVHDSRVWDELLHGEDKSVWADKGYISAEREAAFSKDSKV